MEAQIHHQNEMYRRPLQSKRKNIILDLIEKLVKEKSFLDVGCAEGLFNQFAYDKGANHSVGIDISEKKIEVAKNNFPIAVFMLVIQKILN